MDHRYLTHEVDRRGNLFFLLNGFNGALNKLASEIGGGLQALALAVATPQDNSKEVQAHIDQLTARIKQQADATEAAVTNAKEN